MVNRGIPWVIRHLRVSPSCRAILLPSTVMVGIIGGMADRTSRLIFATIYISIAQNMRGGRLTFIGIRSEIFQKDVLGFLSHVLIIPVNHKEGDLQ